MNKYLIKFIKKVVILAKEYYFSVFSSTEKNTLLTLYRVHVTNVLGCYTHIDFECYFKFGAALQFFHLIKEAYISLSLIYKEVLICGGYTIKKKANVTD